VRRAVALSPYLAVMRAIVGRPFGPLLRFSGKSLERFGELQTGN